MWDSINQSDVELARQKLAELRKVTLQRHEEELKKIDSDESEIDTFARLAEAIANKYLNSGAKSAVQESQAGVPPELQISQTVSPNFGLPLRRTVGR
jgi:hypothetical protein